jgi:hypothetical protein
MTPGQASAGAEQRPIVANRVDQFSVAPVDQFSMSLDSPASLTDFRAGFGDEIEHERR